MADSKYGHYILKEKGNSKLDPATGIKRVVLEGREDWGGIQHRMKWEFVTKPGVVMETRHSHPFDEFLLFYSCTPADETNFSAEIELLLGEEGEPQTITQPTIVCIPQGMVHGPLTFKSVGKPVLFTHICLGPDYKQIPA